MQRRFGVTLLFLFMTFAPSLAIADGSPAGGNPGNAKMGDGDSKCFGELPISCSLGFSINLNIGPSSVDGFKIVTGTNGEVVAQVTGTSNVVPAAVVTIPFLSSMPEIFNSKPYGKMLDGIARCGPFSILESGTFDKCGWFIAATIPGTAGGFQQYAIGWMGRFPFDEGNGFVKGIGLGVGLAVSPDVKTFDPDIVNPNTGIVLPQFAEGVAAGTISPVHDISRVGVIFMVSAVL